MNWWWMIIIAQFGEMVQTFTSVDRDENYRGAWVFFEKKLKEQ
jgi:hypothetical protein